MTTRKRPTERVGLYDPAYEHDACGVAFVARLDGGRTRETVDRAIRALENLEHRGAEGADPNTGDGAGILMQIPDAFFRDVVGDELPAAGAYGVGVVFLPQDRARREELQACIDEAVAQEGQRVVLWRDVPTDKDYCGLTALYHRPYVKHVVIAASDDLAADQDAFERKLYVIRRIAELAAGADLVIPTLSSRTIAYKGMLTPLQLKGYFPELQSPLMETSLALVHSRFSTNTFPSWELAHPYRMIAHNGEINTLRGNVNWMRARESQLRSELFGADLEKVLPIVRPGGSDSATLDNVLELLVLAGRKLPHAMMMLVPEAFEGRDDMSDELKAFYAFHACFMEPWDGPAAVAFTDGRVIGATLDRNGLRPGRWLETKDGWVIVGSESGMLDIEPGNVARRGRLAPGKLFLVDVEQGRIVPDSEVKGDIAGAQALRRLVRTGRRARRRPARARLDAGVRRHARRPPARVRLERRGPAVDPRPDGARRRRADRLDGQRPRAGDALGQVAAAVRLLQAALRAGDQPADRPDPRVDRDVALERGRPGGQPARGVRRARAPAAHGPADPAHGRARAAAPGRPLDLLGAHDRLHLAGRGGSGRAWSRRWRGSARRPRRSSRTASTC